MRRACPAVDGISFNLNPSAGPQVIRGAIRHLWGAREVWIDHAGVRLRVSPGAFFQVNLALLPPIHHLMERHLGDGRLVADLYSGVGTHGLALRGSFSRVLFVEGSRSAVADLKATIRSHGLLGVEVIASAVERALRCLNDPRSSTPSCSTPPAPAPANRFCRRLQTPARAASPTFPASRRPSAVTSTCFGAAGSPWFLYSL
jgi:tRNA/tmRNA/rRNA uracil-C5-methylase (TrmA/RlmC/RlmD family)